MGNVYVEPRPKGREGDAISHYVVEDHADSELHRASTQQDAIDWAKKAGSFTTGGARSASHRQEEAGPVAGRLTRHCRTGASGFGW